MTINSKRARSASAAALDADPLDVVTFGEILWDIYEAEPRREGETISRLLRSELGGAPSNVAIGLARLGVRSAVCGGIGKDAFGESMRAALTEEGVDASLAVSLPERTGLTFVRTDKRGEPSFLFYRRRTADVSIRAKDLPASLQHASWLLLGTSTWMTPGLRNASRAMVKRARAQNAAIVVDLNVRAHLWSDQAKMENEIAVLASKADLVKASDADLAALTGSSTDDDTAAMRWLKAHAPRATWIITRGGGRATSRGPHGAVEAAANTRDVVDATGAGDAFIAGVLATLVAADARPGRPAWNDSAVFTEALAVGHAMGERAVSAVGSISGLTNLSSLRDRLAQMSKATRAKRSTANEIRANVAPE